MRYKIGDRVVYKTPTEEEIQELTQEQTEEGNWEEGEEFIPNDEYKDCKGTVTRVYSNRCHIQFDGETYKQVLYHLEFELIKRKSHWPEWM